jgi:protein gp37
MDEAWAVELREATHQAGAAYFMKQLGGYPDKRGREKALLGGKIWRELPPISETLPAGG